MSAAMHQTPAMHQGEAAAPHTAPPGASLGPHGAPSLEAFLAECQRQGIRLTVQGETIKASGRPPAKPEAFKAYLIAKKPELLKALQPQAIKTEAAPVSGFPKIAQSEAPPGAWRSPDRIAQEKLFYLLSVGEMCASWDPGKPLHQGSVLEDPKGWLEEKYHAYATVWHRCEGEKDPALRSRLESDRELLFSEALGVILLASAVWPKA